MEIFSIIFLFLIFLVIMWSFGSSKADFVVSRLKNEILSNPKELAIRVGEDDIAKFGLILVGEYVFKGFSSENGENEAKKLEKTVNLISKSEKFFLDEVVSGIEPKIFLIHLQIFKGALLIRESESLFKDNDILLNKIKTEIMSVYRSGYGKYFISPYHRQYSYNPSNHNSNSHAEYYQTYYQTALPPVNRLFNHFNSVSSVEDYFRLFSQTFDKMFTTSANKKSSAHFYELVFWTTLQDILQDIISNHLFERRNIISFFIEKMKATSLENGVFSCILMCIKEVFTATCLHFVNNDVKEYECKNYAKDYQNTSNSKLINNVKSLINKNNTTVEPAPVQHPDIPPAPSVPSPMQAERCIPDDNLAGKLICVGLAHIGRKTQLKNKYITDESEAERYSVERPFLDLLFYKFKDDTKRETLRENFMLFKEAYLFLIYRALLKDNPGMQNKVKTMLRIMLSQNSTQTENNARKEYIELFSKRFSYAHKKTKSTKQSLRYAFWNILATKYPDWINRDTVADIMNNDYLYKIFKYSYDAIDEVIDAEFVENDDRKGESN